MNNQTVLNPVAPTILIVDDAPINLLILGEMLKGEGYNVIPVSDGITALNTVEIEKPDLILLDIMMPGIDGYEVCRQLKEKEHLSDIPIIYISALNETENIVKAFKSGGVDYVTKPFQSDEVLARVSTHLKLYRQSNELHVLNTSLSESRDQLKKFASHLQSIREEERVLLANEIHDKIGQILVALKIDMGIWRKKVFLNLGTSESPEILNNFNELVNIVDSTIKTVRIIMSGLKSDVLELLGFVDAAKLYCQEFKTINKIDCFFQSTFSKIEINENQKIALYRIMQESLLNVAKHSNASLVSVSLSVNENKFIMEIVDNGIGFNDTQSANKDSYGILSMKERAFLLGAELIIFGKSNKGTVVRLEMPYVG
jgi:signal transduction histidine kinase